MPTPKPTRSPKAVPTPPVLKARAVVPMDNPPPAGSVWAEIESARMALRWSARKIGTAAGLSPSFYATLARSGWNATAPTRDAVIQALLKAGIPGATFAAPLVSTLMTNIGFDGTPVLAPSQGRLSAVRDALYKSGHPKDVVDSAIAQSTFIDAIPVNELSAYLVLDQEIKQVRDAAPLGTLYASSAGSGERERFESNAESLGKRRFARSASNTRK